MTEAEIEKLKSVKDFDALVEYLRDELYWPIEAKDAEDITFDYNPTELGIDKKHAAKIKSIKQIRPLTDNQPWGLFYVEFAPKKLPVGVLRRILKALIHSRRQRDDRLPTWDFSDLIFISSLGEMDERTISFAHFSTSEQGLPELRPFSWDASDTYFHYLQNTRDLEKLRWPKDENDAEAWREQWSSAFRLTHRYVIRTSRELAVKMAQLAAQIRDQVKSVYDYEVASGPLHKLFESFKKVLIYDLEIDTFADMYAQTIAYGLFSAKATHEGEFAIDNVSAMIPNTNPFLKNLFDECTRIGGTQKDCLDLEELGVTELVKMLKEVNIEAILQDFGKLKRIEDPVIHFYEDFLREYDPKQKVRRGIFYTPDPVVSFIVRSVDYLLRTEFDCPDGLADTSTIPVKVNEEVKHVHKVQILDPAVGTGTFLKYVIEEIRKTFEENHKGLSAEELRKEWNGYVDKNLLPRVFGFELLMAPYAIAHLKLGLKLKETGYEFLSHQRLGVCLTNALESGTASAETLEPYLGWLAQESKYSDYVKTSKNVSVVIGNPPYSVSSENMNVPSILELIEDYKKGCDVEKEIRIAPIQDDYIKFIRWAHWKIDKSKTGIICFITNNSYLDGLIHRAMRKKLLDSFDKIYILNLHGNAKIQEKCPDGSKDENVFDIKQGVSIAFFIEDNSKKDALAKIYYSDLFGTREKKYSFLLSTNIQTIKWQELRPQEGFYFFTPKDFSKERDYLSYISVKDIFKEFKLGVMTGKDHFIIDFSKDSLKRKMQILLDSKNQDDYLRTAFNLKDSRDWKLKNARQIEYSEDELLKINYRLFDARYIYYNDNILASPQRSINQHFLNNNLGLCLSRQLAKLPYQHVFVTNRITEMSYISLRTKEANRLFPLYLYSAEPKRKPLDEKAYKPERTPNFTSEFLQAIKAALGTEPSPEEILYYIYAVLYSPTYRKRYEEFLKIDFPRVPLTSNKDLFKTLRKLGSELVSLHLMKSPEPDNLITEFKGEGDNVVAAIGKNSYKDGKLKINKTQYFEGIPKEVYNFHIGGYQVCQKWLKDRKGRELTEDEIEHYQKIVVALNESIRIMKGIDEVIEGHGGWPVHILTLKSK